WATSGPPFTRRTRTDPSRSRRRPATRRLPPTPRRCAGRCGSPPPPRPPREAARSETATELAVPVRAGEHALGVLTVARGRPGAFDEEETSLLSTLGGQLALALRRAESEAATEAHAGQMETRSDLGLETAALTDLQALFARATEEAGRLIRADHSSVFRFDDRDEVLRLFAVWAREPAAPLEPGRT